MRSTKDMTGEAALWENTWPYSVRYSSSYEIWSERGTPYLAELGVNGSYVEQGKGPGHYPAGTYYPRYITRPHVYDARYADLFISQATDFPMSTVF